jgi:GNAT superfamily N-acetyltransferase
MPLDLRQPDGAMKIPERIYEVLLSVASQRDWQPMGPDLPGQRHIEDRNRYAEKDWRDDYFTPEGQFVTEEDAFGIAEALSRFLPEIPDEDTPVDPDEHTHLAELPVSPHELFRGDGKQLVSDFIDFCRRGGFTIHAGTGLGA